MKNNEINKENKFVIGIRGRLLIGFTLITAIFSIAIMVALSVIYDSEKFLQKISKVDLPTYDTFTDLSYEINKQVSLLKNYILTHDKSYLNEAQLNWTDINSTISKIDKLSQEWNGRNYTDQWSEVKKTLLELRNINFENSLLPTSGINKSLLLAIISIEKKLNEKINSVSVSSQGNSGILGFHSKQIHDDTQKVLYKIENIEYLGLGFILFGILSAIIITILTSRGIIHHINKFREYSSKVAAGDLTQKITIVSHDEIGLLANDFNIMIQGLSTIAKEINQAYQTMLVTIEEIHHSIDSQSSGASEQASSINEITASLSEIEKSSLQTIEKARSLGQAAEKTRENGQLGLDAVDQSVKGMNDVRNKVEMIAHSIVELTNKIQQIGEITSLVNNLAQQSKMLALNASIEAAKAGEAGKGFAVVAVEVKNLAEQSEQATLQVQKIIEDLHHAADKAVMVTEEGTKGVDKGTQLVEQTGEAIKKLNEIIHETTLATQHIESAVRQEGAGIEQITVGMNEINQVTSTFVESVKQTREAMNNLSILSKKLKTYVEMYKV